MTRSHHTVTVVGSRAYIFGGWTNGASLASADIHSISLGTSTTETEPPEYQVLPAIPANEGGPIPSARHSHAACALGKNIAVYGGCAEDGSLVDDGHRIWTYDTEKLTWDRIEPTSHPERTPPQRSEAKLFQHNGNLVLYGGKGSGGSALVDAWHFDCSTKVWNQLPSAPAASTSAALFGDILYVISGSDDLSSRIHILEVKLYSPQSLTWKTLSFPTNPLTPGPRPRENGGLAPVTTGYGRNYLLYFLGDRHASPSKVGDGETASGENAAPGQWSDMWTFQLPSSDVEFKATTAAAEAVKPAKLKDQIRTKLGADTGNASWAEAEVQPPGDIQKHEGKLHPGPRSHFGYCQTVDGRSVVIWGGLDAKGQQQGDGWIVQLH